MAASITVAVNPEDTTRRATPRKQHVVIVDGRIVYEASDKPEALYWADGFAAGLAAANPDEGARQ